MSRFSHPLVLKFDYSALKKFQLEHHNFYLEVRKFITHLTPVGIRQPCHHKVQLLGVACIYWQLKTDVKETKSEWSGMPYSWFNLMCRIAAKFCLPLPSAGLGWPGLGLTRPCGLMAASQPLPEPMPIDTFSPSFNFCQKSLIQFLKFYILCSIY